GLEQEGIPLLMNDFTPKREYITNEEQLKRWVEGDSVHRLDEQLFGGECCPDFSCCKPALQAEEKVRRAFASASRDERMSFLGTFLSALIEYAQKSGDLPSDASFSIEFGQEKQ